MTLSSAVQSILETYDSSELNDIAIHGCSSGCATSHIYYTQTNEFFHEFETEIEDYLHDVFGDGFLTEFANNSVRGMINKMVWCFIEIVAANETNNEDAIYGEVA